MSTTAGLHHSMLLSSNINRSYRQPQFQPPPPRMLLPRCGLSKQGKQFFTSLTTSSAAGDPSATNRLIRKFIASSSKSVALNAISHLLSPNTSHPRLSPLVLPMYVNISKAAWFDWNPKLIADVIALLYKHERFEEAKTLILEAVSKLEPREQELGSFYCSMIDSHSKQKSKQGVFDSYASLKQLLSRSSSTYLKKRAYESLIGGLCNIDLPREAENLLEEMKSEGLKLSAFKYRSVIYSYGRLGLFEEMKRVVGLMEDEGYECDVVCSTMVLSSLGTHGELMEMVTWVRRVKELGIPFSIRTYNSVLISCPTIMSMVQEHKSMALSINELMENLSGYEALLVQELSELPVVDQAMEWNASELKLDLHGMRSASTYLIMLQWFHQLRLRFCAGNQVVPAEIVVVCGLGKNSTVRGESPVKGLVREMIHLMKCPLRIDKENAGRFIAKGKVLIDWLC